MRAAPRRPSRPSKTAPGVPAWPPPPGASASSSPAWSPSAANRRRPMPGGRRPAPALPPKEVAMSPLLLALLVVVGELTGRVGPVLPQARPASVRAIITAIENDRTVLLGLCV